MININPLRISGVVGISQAYRCLCVCSSPSSSAVSGAMRVVYMGSPQVAADVLRTLLTASRDPQSVFSIVAVVTRPPAHSGEKEASLYSPVHTAAEYSSLPVLTPSKPSDPEFLTELCSLKPDLCITAAYGHYLPTKFLSIPKYGTVNIHPSLLPKYRGASPVQRALENGETEVGVSLLYTEKELDAGPVIHQEPWRLVGHEKAPEVMSTLFGRAAEALLRLFPVMRQGCPQDGSSSSRHKMHRQLGVEQEGDASYAHKICAKESRIDFAEMGATAIHNKCRAFAEWPGTWAQFDLEHRNRIKTSRIKIVTTVVIKESCERISNPHSYINREVVFVKGDHDGYLRIVCGDGSVLGVTELQPVGKRVMKAKAFNNGLVGKTFRWTAGNGASNTMYKDRSRSSDQAVSKLQPS